MAVVSTPKVARMQFRYPGDASSFTLSGIRPGLAPIGARLLLDAMLILQQPQPNSVRYTTENVLTEDQA